MFAYADCRDRLVEDTRNAGESDSESESVEYKTSEISNA